MSEQAHDPDADVPEEAIADAYAEIDRAVLGAEQVSGPISLSVDEQSRQLPSEFMAPAVDAVPASRTLDDLYLNHREIGTGTKFLRIERKEPPALNGVRIAGFLEDISEKLTMNEFAQRFGGGTYYVHVMGPARGYDDDGRPAMKTLERMRLVLPGQAKMPRYDGAMMMGQQTYAYGGPPAAGSHPEVEIAKMQMEARQRERLEDERRKLTEQAMRAQAMPQSIFSHIEEVGEKRATEVRQVMEENISRLKRENERLNMALEQRDATVQQLREQVIKEQGDFAARIRETETVQTRELRERYETQLRELRERHNEDMRRETERHAAEIARASDERTRAINDISERHGRERKEYEESQQRERTRLLDDFTRREASATNESARREASVKDMYESRLTELQRTYEGRLGDQARSLERELAALRDQTAREVMSIRSTEEGKTAVSKEFAGLQANAYQGKVTALEQELSSVRMQLAEAQRILNKPVREQIRDAHELAAETGFGGQREDDGDWKKQAFSMIRDVVPEVAKHLGDTRSANKQAAEQANRAGSTGRPQLEQAHAGGHQAKAGPVQQGARGYRVPMPGMSATPPAWGAGPRSPFESAEQAQPPSPPSVHVPPPEPGRAQPVAPAQDGLAGMLTEERVSEFIGSLNVAIMTGTVTPKEFAAEFVERVGLEAAANIVQKIPPDAVADAVAKTKDGASTLIPTREGRKYVAELWRETAALIGTDVDQPR